ncbi:MAG: hypothetical protein IIA65_01645 [Planctomycetes bacterium]|nr:hypothetical protein [Planctomycetota bacterium]
MLFWIAILVGIVVGTLATRIGFYETLVHSFNLSVSVYLAVFLTPFVVTHVPATVEIPTGLPLTLAGLVVGSFILLYGISYLLFTGQFTIAFPKVIDLPLSALVGFLAGRLMVSFLAVILSITPSPWVETLLGQGILETHTKALRSSCDRIHRFVRAGEPAINTGHILAWLADSKKAGEGRQTVGPRDVNEAAGAPTDNTTTN